MSIALAESLSVGVGLVAKEKSKLWYGTEHRNRSQEGCVEMTHGSGSGKV